MVGIKPNHYTLRGGVLIACSKLSYLTKKNANQGFQLQISYNLKKLFSTRSRQKVQHLVTGSDSNTNSKQRNGRVKIRLHACYHIGLYAACPQTNRYSPTLFYEKKYRRV